MSIKFNITESISQKIGKNLYNTPNHPLKLIKDMIYEALPNFEKLSVDNPVVSVENNFDNMLIPLDHPSRSFTDTYYYNDDKVLRTHTSAHQFDFLKAGKKQFVVTGDVYRRDEIDKNHYPVFHQMEGVCLCENPQQNLMETLNGIIDKLFGNIERRFVDSYFPFTNPSWELEIYWKDSWLEVAGMGIIQPEILDKCGIKETGWAFGLGLERLAMILFDIPDIRLFWTEDRRFLDQFKNGPVKYVPYSKYPSCYKDISFWVNETYNHNNFYELVRAIGQDLIAEVKLIDSFVKNGRTSYCYRIEYQSMDRTLTNETIDLMQSDLRLAVVDLGVELR